MSQPPVADAVREFWKAECRALPVIATIAAAVCAAVWIGRLDQHESASFLIGTLVGGLLTCVLASAVFIVRLGRAIRGGPKSGLVAGAYRLARGR